MAWSIVGFILALALIALALPRSHAPAGYYDGEVYGMTPKTHFGYACVGVFFLATFALLHSFHLETATIVALGVLMLVAIFYASSFLRGASDE